LASYNGTDYFFLSFNNVDKELMRSLAKTGFGENGGIADLLSRTLQGFSL
jgi:hypothetical protein